MQKYELKNVRPFAKEQVMKGTWIILHKVKRVPPHLALIVNGKYFSLSVNGLEKMTDAEQVLTKLELRKSSDVFIQVTGNHTDAEALACQSFADDLNLNDPALTCLVPLKFFLEKYTGISLQKTRFIFEVIQTPGIEIQQVLQLNAESLMTEHTLFLPEYSMEEIRSCIGRLNARKLTTQV